MAHPSNPRSYTFLDPYESSDFTCIADTRTSVWIDGTRKWKRCGHKVRKLDCLRAREEAHSMAAGSARNEKIRNFLSLHCCTQAGHRSELLAVPTTSLDMLVADYSRLLSMGATDRERRQDTPSRQSSGSNNSEIRQTRQESTTQTRSPLPQLSLSSPSPSPSPSSTSSSSSSAQPQPAQPTGITLRSGRTVPDSDTQPTQPCFVPYTTRSTSSVHTRLHDPIPSSYSEPGEVYSFTWPSHPSFVKIGYTKHTAASRMMASWYKCHPGSRISQSTRIPFPKRMEELVHRELMTHRHQITLCARSGCDKRHIEWFKLPAETVNQVIDEWRRVDAADLLYDPATRELSSRWRARLKDWRGPVTARALLDVLLAEEMQARELADPVRPRDGLGHGGLDVDELRSGDEHDVDVDVRNGHGQHRQRPWDRSERITLTLAELQALLAASTAAAVTAVTAATATAATAATAAVTSSSATATTPLQRLSSASSWRHPLFDIDGSSAVEFAAVQGTGLVAAS